MNKKDEQEIKFISDITLYDQFCKNAGLDYNRAGWTKRRKDAMNFGYVLIADKGHNFGSHWVTWWEPFIGLTIFAKLCFKNCKYTNKTILTHCFPIRLTNTLIHEGRELPAKAFILL